VKRASAHFDAPFLVLYGDPFWSSTVTTCSTSISQR
jgi:hypothetical protein